MKCLRFLKFISVYLSCLLTLVVAPEGAQSQGHVSSRPCPYSCRSQGIPKKHCKDWKQGNICYVEDLRRQPAPQANNPAWQQLPPVVPNHQSQAGSLSIPGRPQPVPDSGGCQQTHRRQIAPPYVNISQVRPSGNVFKNKYRIFGSVEGVCIVEAGAFEDGRKIQAFPIPTSRQFQRVEFDVQVRGDRHVEIRVYNIHGDRDVYVLDPNRDTR